METIDAETFAMAIEDEISSEFCDSELDEDFCRNAGSIGGVEISGVTLDDYTAEDQEITGAFSITFHESYYNGCRDLSWRLPWDGTASFSIARATGEMKIEIEAERLPEEEDDDE